MIVNPINSRYALAYKNIEGNAKVEYTDKTQWGSTGIIDSYDSNYTRKVRVVIDNTGKNGQAVTDFKVYGGYAFNSEVSIDLKDGYQTIPGGYEESVNVGNKRLVDIIEKDTDCVTKDSKECIYGGGTITNYLQYPTSEDPKANLWRITGSYQVDGETLAKIVYNSNYGTNTTQDQIETILNTFYGTLDKADTIIQNTDKFNCTKGSCIVSDYSKLGLLSTYEYEQAGGNESYLGNTNNWFALESGSIKNITPSGIVDAREASGIRPTAYLQTGVNVTGKGTSEDPYRISPKGDINILAYTIDGKPTNETLQSLLSSKIVNKITCENNSKASWDYEKNAVVIEDLNAPESCAIDFEEGYIVNMNVIGGKATPGSIGVGLGINADFTIQPDTKNGYYLGGMTVTCPNATIEKNEKTGKITLSNIKASQTCNVTLKKSAFIAQILADNNVIGTRTDFSTVFTGTSGLHVENNEQFLEEDGNLVNAVYYYVGNVNNNWVKFGKEGNDDIWWRIIRTNEDGSTRLLYAGKGENGHETTTGYIENIQTPYITNGYASAAYAGYMYGSGSLEKNRENTTSSTVKQKLDPWYSENLATKYGTYLSKTAIYCNDRSTNTYSRSDYVYFGGSMRLTTGSNSYTSIGVKENSQVHPTYRCGGDPYGTGLWPEGGATGDKFTAQNSSNIGNQNLTYPVALISADEVVYAGGFYSMNNQDVYYYRNSSNSSEGALKSVTGDKNWWTMTPDWYEPRMTHSFMKSMYIFNVSGNSSSNTAYGGSLSYDVAHSESLVIRPVISLKSCVGVSGNGTVSNPYIPSIDEACAAADN